MRRRMMRKGREVRKGELLMCSWIAILQQRLITDLCGGITRQGSELVSVHESAACGVLKSGDKAVPQSVGVPDCIKLAPISLPSTDPKISHV